MDKQKKIALLQKALNSLAEGVLVRTHSPQKKVIFKNKAFDASKHKKGKMIVHKRFCTQRLEKKNRDNREKQERRTSYELFIFSSDKYDRMTGLPIQSPALKQRENALRQAISQNELVLYYQPKTEMLTRKVVSAEALVRWQHPTQGLIPPNQFIPLAEQTGLIVPLGDWVLEEACRQVKIWRKEGFVGLTVAVNLSPVQFKSGDIALSLAKGLWEGGCPPEALEIELTEGMVMENPGKAALMLKVLKSMGIQLSIDDFGSGYSSLGFLTQLPFDSLKLSYDFTKTVPGDPKMSAMICSILSMAKNLGLKVIAEGIETQAQWDFFKKEGCDLVQGYLVGRPMTAEAFGKILAAQKGT